MEKFVVHLLVLCFIKTVITADTPPNLTANQKQENSLRRQYTVEQAALDAQALHDAVVGLGTDEQKIVDIIPKRTNAERQIIRKTYTEYFNSDVIKDLKGDLSGHFKNLISALMYEPEVYIVKHIHKMIKSIPSLLSGSFLHLSEIFGTKSGAELRIIKENYRLRYNTSIEEDMVSILPDDNQRKFLLEILKNERNASSINTKDAENQVKLIPEKAGECSPSNNADLFSFFAKESFDQILYVIALYEGRATNLTENNKVLHQLHTWCDDPFLLDSYSNIVRYAMNETQFFAVELHDAVHGLGTEDDKLIRLIVTHSETDLYRIKEVYEELFKKTLISSVEADTSGYYKITLKTLIERSDLYKNLIDVRSKFK